MKKMIYCKLMLVVIVAPFMTAAVAQKKPKVYYTHDFPAAMLPDVKEGYIKLFEKGRVLYQINCAQCHNKKEKDYELMPEFTKADLAKYELRLQNPKHEEALAETRVNAEELGQIMVFLTYYKKVDTRKKKSAPIRL